MIVIDIYYINIMRYFNILYNHTFLIINKLTLNYCLFINKKNLNKKFEKLYNMSFMN